MTFFYYTKSQTEQTPNSDKATMIQLKKKKKMHTLSTGQNCITNYYKYNSIINPAIMTESLQSCDC